MVSVIAALASGGPGTGDDVVGGSGPRIVAIDNTGKKYIIQQFTSLKKGKKALEPMRAELHRMGRSAWFEAHDVPSDFDTWGEDEPA